MRSESILRLMSVFVLIGVFAAGTLFGAGLMRWNAPPHPPPHFGGPIEAIKHELDLDAAQIAALDMIAASHRPALDAIGRETQGKVRRTLLAIEDELVPRLRPDQVEKLAHWRKMRPSLPPPMGPHPPPH
jgi:hypothetical protein